MEQMDNIKPVRRALVKLPPKNLVAVEVRERWSLVVGVVSLGLTMYSRQASVSTSDSSYPVLALQTLPAHLTRDRFISYSERQFKDVD